MGHYRGRGAMRRGTLCGVPGVPAAEGGGLDPVAGIFSYYNLLRPVGSGPFVIPCPAGSVTMRPPG